MSTLVSNEKGSLAHSTSGSARVDLFFKTVRRISLESLHQLLENSWNEDPLDTLKLTFYNRDCRGGKGERQVFYESIKWIILNKGPEHLIANLDLLSDYGRWDDALWFLTPKKEKSTKRPAKKQKLDNEQEKKPEDAMVVDEAPEKVEPELTPEQKAIFDEVTEAVGQHFAKQLKADLEAMNSESKEKKVSLCAKWAPSENGKHDKKVGATKVICKALGINEATYRKTYLVPLRKYLHIIETPMCTEHFELIDYSKVPGVAMNKFKDIFSKKDAERFNQYKESLKKGETKVNAATVEPHEVVRQFMYQTPDQETILEEQWKVILERVRSLGTLSKCLVVSDVSGSMSGTPMEVSVALGIMIAQLTSGPFNNHLITFSSEPKLHKMVGNTLNEQVKDVMAMEWGMSTDFQKVFDLVLRRAVDNNLPQEEMPEKIFVISDMQFDQAGGSNFGTHYQILQQKFGAAGYLMPKIVFWNVRASEGNVTNNHTDQDVAMISGFSPSVLKAVLNGKDFSPFSVMKEAINDERYNKIVLGHK